MTTTADTYPMPTTDCPRWCQEDHEPSWQTWLSTALAPTPVIPAASGGFLTGPGTPIHEWLAQWKPYHRVPVAVVELEADERIDVDLVRIGDDTAHLYVEGNGAMTPEQARTLALALLDAVDELEKGQR